MKKEPKKIPAKKLPALLKKSYTEAELEKKLLQKLYIQADRDFLALQFTADEKSPHKRHIAAAEYALGDFVRLKSLAKQIKNQKGRLKLIPLAAVAAFIAGIIVCAGVFRDPIVKRALIHILQKAAGAKVEIASVKLRFLDSSLTVNRLVVADKNAPMKNVFEAQKLQADFNLVQLLKRRFVCENLEVSGMAFGTERKTSGELPQVRKKAKKHKEKTDDTEKGEAVAFMYAQRQAALLQGQKILSSLFESLNPHIFLENALKRLKTPEEVQAAQDLAERLISVWENRPAELERAVSEFRKSAEHVLSRDYQSIRDIDEVQAAVTELNAAIQDGKKLTDLTEHTVKDLQNDSASVSRAARRAVQAVKTDTAFINAEINKIKSFTVADGKKILSRTFEASAYSALGTYYPYAEKAFGVLSKMQSGKTEAKGKKPVRRAHRMAGRTVEYGTDIYPRFLIRRMFASGTGFESRLADISSDPDRWGKPLSFTGMLDEKAAGIGDERVHTADASVNTGKKLESPLFTAAYTGTGYALSFKPADAVAEARTIVGIPSFSGKAKIEAAIKIQKSGRFGIDALLDFDTVHLSAESFEPAFISRIYNEILDEVHTVSFRVKTEFSRSDAETDIQTDADTVFMAALQKGINKELEAIKKQAVQSVQNELETYIGPLNERLGVFAGIEKGVMGQKEALDLLQAQLEKRKKELTKRAEHAGKEALNKAAEQALDAASEKVKDAAGEAAGKALKGLFGR